MDDRPDATDPREQRFNEVLGAYLEAEDAGWAPEPKALITSYPDLAKKLEAFFVAQSRVAGRLYPCPVSARKPGKGGHTSVYDPGAGTDSSGYDPKIGDSVGDYVLEKLIKEGGQGKVFKARQKTAKSIEVALKMIKKNQASTPKAVRAIIREAEAIANLDHPQIVPIRYVGEHDGVPYFSMKFFEAGSLQNHLQRFEDDHEAAARLMMTTARAVHYAHEHSLLHRDLKPGNILLDGKDQPIVADFGLAKLLPAPADVPIPRRAGAPTTDAPETSAEAVNRPPQAGDKTNADGLDSKTQDRTLTAAPTDTHAGAFIGTKGYAPPENTYVAKDSATVRADVFGLGAILYRMLTGIQLFDAEKMDIMQYTYQVRNFPVPPPRQINPKVNERLEAVCLKSLRTEPADRYATPAEMADDLERWLRGEPPLAWPKPWRMRAWNAVRAYLLVAAAAMSAGFALAAVFFMLYWFDPERVPRALEAKARRGPVTLIGPTGPPVWSRWIEGEDAVMVSREMQQPFYYTAAESGRLELLPHAPGPRYRFKAEVKHERNVTQTSLAGLYFGSNTVVNDVETKHFWFSFLFSEFGPSSIIHRGPDGRQNWSQIALMRRRFQLPTDGPSTVETKAKNLFLPAQSTGLLPDWQPLEIVVESDKVQAWWQHRQLPPVSLAELDSNFESVKERKIVRRDSKFSSHGGLGVFVYSGKASFRNVIVEPLD
jgi:serine/threonine protein kinase